MKILLVISILTGGADRVIQEPQASLSACAVKVADIAARGWGDDAEHWRENFRRALAGQELYVATNTFMQCKEEK